MRNAHEIVWITFRNVDSDEKPLVWTFLNEVLMAISPEVVLNDAQGNLLLAMMQEVAIEMHTAILVDKLQRRRWVLQIATWVNGAHVANRYV